MVKNVCISAETAASFCIEIKTPIKKRPDYAEDRADGGADQRFQTCPPDAHFKADDKKRDQRSKAGREQSARVFVADIAQPEPLRPLKGVQQVAEQDQHPDKRYS